MSSRSGRSIRLVGFTATTLLALWLGTLLPQLVALFLAVWMLALFLDILSTWRMYLLEPKRFSDNESNMWFVVLYERLGFMKSVPLFLALVEIPRFVLVAFFCAPLIGALLSLSTSYSVGVGVAAAAQGYAHFDGWRVNRAFLSSKKGPVNED